MEDKEDGLCVEPESNNGQTHDTHYDDTYNGGQKINDYM